MKLSELNTGQSAIIVRVAGHGGFRKRIMEMGFVRGERVVSVLDSPMHDPVKYTVMGYDVSLRRREAAMIEVLSEEEAAEQFEPSEWYGCSEVCESCGACGCSSRRANPLAGLKVVRKNRIRVALVGNPNSGKTSLFNALSGGSEHVGNYSGVTVSATTGKFNYKGYRIELTDLPGTYSLSAYSPEEVFVRHHLMEEMPDVIINSVVASNLKRNLFLTTELIDLNQRTVVALNMFDELQASGAKLDHESLGAMMGVPMIPAIARTRSGLDKLLDTVIELFEGRNKTVRHIHINYGPHVEEAVAALSEQMHAADDLPHQFPVRYWALKILEGDKEVRKALTDCKDYALWLTSAEKGAARIERHLDCDTETAISDAKYGFIDGALTETLTEGTGDPTRRTRRIDRLVSNRWLGFPIFILLMWLMFWTVFTVGAYPQGWIESLFAWLGDIVGGALPEGWLRALLVDGVIGGVGSVAVFLPNILLLYLFISLMEDSGYMARAAFIMDKLMHRLGLHGKSFIPMLMGFGCNVPAIMATRTIESHSSRLITILITPFMSCSARLPVYVLFAGAFFPGHSATVLIGLYLLGIAVAALTARLLRRTKFKVDETPFVMELPPYRMPTLRSTVKHMWDKCAQYLRKIGSVVLVASVVVWFLGYFPRPAEESIAATNAQEQSYIAHIGKAIEPVMRPMDIDWRGSVALLASIPAKELVVSTLGVLYNTEEESLAGALVHSGDYSPRSAAAFMVFILLFFPCIATIAAIRSETGSRGWAAFAVIYNTLVAWIVAYLVYLIGGLF
ncbi:MAG: ferrous iron transport protein B [Tidjanibacter sp.]|nr:ferrous iron transport protein B [Tidjanibacter sp.]